ncbi:hypothetical protein DAC17_99 [Bacteroides phage DAC17]|jgi:hypothetical protein|nr:hypothetical protein DAC17_99 [Bacteroides phage DAC17]
MPLSSHDYASATICSNRLVREWNKYEGKLVVAFDFDNTIFDYHNAGLDCHQVIGLLGKCSDLGFIMVLFTANDDAKKLAWMKEYCEHYGIRVDYINESPVMQTKKPYYNILLDDRAGLDSAYTILEDAVDRIEILMMNKCKS